MTYYLRLADIEIKIENKCEEFEKRLNSVLSAYEIQQTKNFSVLIEIDKSLAVLKVKDKVVEIKNEFTSRDIFQLIHLLFSIILFEHNLYLMHSVLVSKDDKGILLVGGFRQGKTTLSFSYRDAGYTIESGDMTILKINNQKLYAIYGSKKIVDKTYETYIDEADCNIEIKEILNLVGVCDKGMYVEEKLEDELSALRCLWNNLTWQYFCPFTSGFVPSSYLSQDVYDNLKKMLNINIYSLRGDRQEILKKHKI